jgi:hypothetical protein
MSAATYRRRVSLGVAMLSLLSCYSPSQAMVYLCKYPDGTMVYTDTLSTGDQCASLPGSSVSTFSSQGSGPPTSAGSLARQSPPGLAANSPMPSMSDTNPNISPPSTPDSQATSDSSASDQMRCVPGLNPLNPFTTICSKAEASPAAAPGPNATPP